jgi:hypothetical protein
MEADAAEVITCDRRHRHVLNLPSLYVPRRESGLGVEWELRATVQAGAHKTAETQPHGRNRFQLATILFPPDGLGLYPSSHSRLLCFESLPP